MFSVRLLSLVIFLVLASSDATAMFRSAFQAGNRQNSRRFCTTSQAPKKASGSWKKIVAAVTTGVVVAGGIKWQLGTWEEQEAVVRQETAARKEVEKAKPEALEPVAKEALKTLIARLSDQGINPNDFDMGDDSTIFMLACGFEDLDWAKSLIRLGGVKLNAQDKDGHSALSHAIMYDNIQVVEFLLAQEGIDMASPHVIYCLNQNRNPTIIAMFSVAQELQRFNNLANE